MLTFPSFNDVLAAADRIKPFIRQTPLLSCSSLDQALGLKVFFKCENLQKVGAFKFRGATNAVFSLSADEARKGVVAHSSGNHAQALALAARNRGVQAYIAMPNNAPEVKKQAVSGYGAKISFCEPTLAAREETQAHIIAATGATVVHPYDNAKVIAGQGTAALEMLAEVPDLDVIMAPVGGGGLLSGTALAVKGVSKKIRVVGAEPEMANDAYQSLQLGMIVPAPSNPTTIADGLLTSLGQLNFPIIQELVDQIVTTSESAIIAAMRFFWERTKLIIEPSSAVPLAVLWENRELFAGLRIGVILSGGNVDLSSLPWQDSAISSKTPVSGRSLMNSPSIADSAKL